MYNIALFIAYFTNLSLSIFTKICKNILKKTKQELRLRNYNSKTIKVYLGYLKEYFDFKKFDLEKIDEESIKQFLLDKKGKNYSS